MKHNWVLWWQSWTVRGFFHSAWVTFRSYPWYEPVPVLTVFLLVLFTAMTVFAWWLHPLGGLLATIISVWVIFGMLQSLSEAAPYVGTVVVKPTAGAVPVVKTTPLNLDEVVNALQGMVEHFGNVRNDFASPADRRVVYRALRALHDPEAGRVYASMLERNEVGSNETP